MSPRVLWGPAVPAEVRTSVEPLLARLLPLLPTWVHLVRVEYDSADESVACITTREHYRDLALTIAADWFTYDASERPRVLLHEFSHAITAPMDRLLRDVVDRVIATYPDASGPDAEFLRDLRMQASERATCDLEHALSVAATLGTRAIGGEPPATKARR